MLAVFPKSKWHILGIPVHFMTEKRRSPGFELVTPLDSSAGRAPTFGADGHGFGSRQHHTKVLQKVLKAPLLILA